MLFILKTVEPKNKEKVANEQRIELIGPRFENYEFIKN